MDGGKQFFKDNDEQLRGEFLIRTELALRQHALGTSRPRRQGSVDERPDKIAGPPLTPLLARQALGGRNARLLKRKEWCARTLEEGGKKWFEILKLVLDKAGAVRDGSGAGDCVDGGGHCPEKGERPDPAEEIV